MYHYEWDLESRGFLLTKTTEQIVGRELRPVYAKELDLLGFDKYWKYPKTPHLPLLWAENNNYIYQGEIVAKTHGGTYTTAPMLQNIKPKLTIKPINIELMIEKNKEILDALVHDALRNIYKTFEENKKNYDIFYVAFSGGKDSIVALDLVHRALPSDVYMVLFGNTTMELPDTYRFIETVKSYYSDIRFEEARSFLSSEESWNLFGPPARTIRWCCGLHKTAPQIIHLRRILNKINFKGLAFTGIRGEESAARSEYEMYSIGKKTAGQDSFHTILNWNTAELYLYIFSQKLPLNPAYELGCHRVGCLVCPMSGGKHEYIKMQAYPVEMQKYIDIITNTSSKSFDSCQDMRKFIDDGGWNLRKSGRELNIGVNLVVEKSSGDTFRLLATLHDDSWKEWMKTIGSFSQIGPNEYLITYNSVIYPFTVINNDKNVAEVVFEINHRNGTAQKYFQSLIKSVFRKAAYCVKCGICEGECKYGYIQNNTNKIIINDKCTHCLQCHNINNGCMRYCSLKLPIGDTMENNTAGFDRYLTFGFKREWLTDYLSNPETYWDMNNLGSKMIAPCKNFLRDSGILPEGKDLSLTEFGAIVQKLGSSSTDTWALMLVNAAYTRQIGWYVKNIKPGISYTKNDVMAMLPDDIKTSVKENIVDAYKNILKGTPIGSDLGLGEPFMSGKTMKSFTRKDWDNPTPLVILYALYKYAEANAKDEVSNIDESQYIFTLSRLLLEDKTEAGISPTLLFSLNRDVMQKIIVSLSIEYPAYISSSFTHNLDNISLNVSKTAKDVLNLINGGL